MNAASDQFDVAVAGRGAVGCALAIGLAQHGLRVALIGPATVATPPDAGWDLRVFAISRASMALFESLRIARQLDWTRIAPIRDMQVATDPSGRGGGHLHLSAYAACVPELAWIIEGRNLQRALDLGCEMQGRISIVDDVVTGFEASDAYVSVDTQRARRLTARLLVAADGARSPIRTAAGIGGEQRDYAHSGVVTDFVCEQPHGDVAYQWFLGDSILALLPLPAHDGAPGASRHVSIVWSVPPERAAALLRLDGADLAREVEQACGQRLGAMRALEAPAAFPLKYFIADPPVQPRLALVGDAAHWMHPLAGQGMNAGLLDAAALIEVLAAREPFRDLGDLRLLRRYARARAADLRMMMGTTDLLKRLFEAPGPVPKVFRTAGMNLLDHLPVIKNRLIRQAMG